MFKQTAGYARIREDRPFAEAVARWRGRLAPALEEVATVDPPHRVWAGISAQLGSRAANDNTAALSRRVVAWRRTAFAAASIAAVLLLTLFIWPDATPIRFPQDQSGSLLVATVNSTDGELQLVANWDSSGRRLIITSAELSGAAEGQAHELWVIPAGSQTPRSLGVLRGTGARTVGIASTVAAQMEAGATLAVSVEPAGGSPTGLPTGPVIASGMFEAI